ncbi:MAG: hypothetical protein A4C66_05940 [Nitrospira sp. HN-bin3]|uniref:hypothetical protein n=1 Tax=Nitrospira cf. moscoviensis SBR1015 TaxID=96242 RepID=UPI000A0EC06C|nr:hypothetical protein [Nitrospira cf. moscoviensis SBR1015]OQW48868.1 MAG: hypothetical protein A4C66_05940 [Nitrospira sp. HN-bin3]
MAIERFAWEPIADTTPLPQVIRKVNTEMARWADILSRMQRPNRRLVSAATTLTEWDDSVDVDTTSGNITVTLPPAASVPGKQYHIKKSVAANTLTVDGNGSETIDGAATLAWTTQYQSYLLESVIVTAPATWGWKIR